MEKKEYTVVTGSGEQKVYQSQLNIRQAKELTALFTANKITLGEELDVMNIIADIYEKNLMVQFAAIVLTDSSGAKLGSDLDEDRFIYSTFFQIALDFFTINLGWGVLFGSTTVKRVMTEMTSSSSSTKTGSQEGSLNSSEKISEAEKKNSTGSSLTQQSVN